MFFLAVVNNKILTQKIFIQFKILLSSDAYTLEFRCIYETKWHQTNDNLIGTLQILETYTPICCELMTHRYMLIFMNEDVFV
jgi:hypothetical protein